MTQDEHLLAVIEPAAGGDPTLDLAKETVARGGTASLLMVVTDRVREDITAFAESEDLEAKEAETVALDRLRSQCSMRVGGAAKFSTHHGPVGSDIVRHVTDETTAVAIPARLVSDKLVERIAAYSGLPVIVVPNRIPLPAPSSTSRRRRRTASRRK